MTPSLVETFFHCARELQHGEHRLCYVFGLDEQLFRIGPAFHGEDGALPVARGSAEEQRQHAHALRIHLVAKAVRDGVHGVLRRRELADPAGSGEALR